MSRRSVTVPPTQQAEAAAQTNPRASAPLLLRDADLAQALSVSRATVQRWRHSGRIPRPVHIGGAVRWSRDEVEQWIAAGCPGRGEWESRRAE
jgi:excisionase family DNA binding protein